MPGAWRAENIEGKATLGAIIAEGQWKHFRRWCLDRSSSRFERDLRARLDKALDEGRLRPEPLEQLLGSPRHEQELDEAA